MNIHTKAIAKAEKIIQDAIDKIEAMRDDAQRNFWDTGYNRYYNKMHDCEEALDELTKYLDCRKDVKRYRQRINTLESVIRLYERKLDELRDELKGDVPDVELNYIIERCKARLELAFVESGGGLL